MINQKIFNAILGIATKDAKETVIKALIKHIENGYDYNDNRVGHILEMLVDKDALITPEKVNLKWIESHPERLMYQIDKYNIRNISIDYVDNIDCTVRVNFEYIEKINEDRDDISYASSHTDISFNDYPEILK